jgi:hypothetical protein
VPSGQFAFGSYNLVAKIQGNLAAHYDWGTGERSVGIDQAADAASHMPARELGGIRPPARDILLSDFRPGRWLLVLRGILRQIRSELTGPVERVMLSGTIWFLLDSLG